MQGLECKTGHNFGVGISEQRRCQRDSEATTTPLPKVVLKDNRLGWRVGYDLVVGNSWRHVERLLVDIGIERLGFAAVEARIERWNKTVRLN